MTFYFAWVKDKEAFNPQIHNREEEEVVHLEILHQEGEFPTALLRIKNLKETGKCRPDMVHRQVKYLNNRIESDHGKLKRLIKPTLGFKSMKTAYATLKGFEVKDV